MPAIDKPATIRRPRKKISMNINMVQVYGLSKI
jgi:hypothetical protein